MSLTEILVVAGEASGDSHAAGLIERLRSRSSSLRFFGMGGPKLAAAGADLLYGTREISVMGFSEVLPKLRRILHVMKGLERAAARRRPACAILVDVPDFNLRLAARLKRLGIPVIYYVSPMIWAWRGSRIHQIARDVDAMLCILPFEEGYYRERGVTARYVGSPVLEGIPEPGPAARFRRALGLPEEAATLAVLPGSRPGEVRRLLPTLARAAAMVARNHPGLSTVVPVAPGLERAQFEEAFAAAGARVHLIDGRAPEVVGASDVAVVASGTATLEAGLMERPVVVVYRVSPLNYWIGKALLRLPYFSLLNLLAERPLVPELIQSELRPERVAQEVERLWTGADRAGLLAGLNEVRARLGPPGAAERAAEVVWDHLRSRLGSPRPE